MEKILLLGTGGTIAGTAAHANLHTTYRAATLRIDEVLAAVSHQCTHDLGLRVESEQVSQIDSKDTDHGHWQVLAQRCARAMAQADVSAVVITHGTDTLEETAWFLQQVLAPCKPLVLTCAMRPATALMADGPQNLSDALCVAASLARGDAAVLPGVLVVCAGQVHQASSVQKIHPYRLDAFSSGEAGPLGWVEQGQLRWSNPHMPFAVSLEAHPHAQQALRLPAKNWPWVALVHSHAGADARHVRALVAAGVRGLVIAGTGNGTVHSSLLGVLLQAQAQGVAVQVGTRCANGHMVGPFADSPLHTAPAGLNPYKARISLMLDLMDPVIDQIEH